MDAVPKRYGVKPFQWTFMDPDPPEEDPFAQADGPLKIIYGADIDGIIVECEIARPKSSHGRTVYLWVRGEDVTDLMKELRAEAVRQRSKPMNG